MEYIYGALLLHKLGKPVNEDNLKKVITATGAHIDEAKIKILIASLEGVDIAAELENASAFTAPAAAPAEEKPAEAPPVTGEVPAEAKPEEKAMEKEAMEKKGLSQTTMAWIAVVVIVVVAGIGYYMWQKKKGEE